MPQRPLRIAPWLLLLPLLLAASCGPVELVVGVLQADGRLPLEVVLRSGQDAEEVRIELDGEDVTGLFVPGAGRLVGSVPLPAPGRSSLQVAWPGMDALPGVLSEVRQTFVLDVPDAAPAFTGLSPQPVAGVVPATAWVRIGFAAMPAPEAVVGAAFGVECDGEQVPRRLHLVADAVLLDPTPALPPEAECRVAWRGPGGGIAEVAFRTAGVAAAFRVLHDREDPGSFVPFPDDFYTREDPATPTGLRIEIDDPPYAGTLLDVYRGVLAPVRRLDGFSRVAPWVLAFEQPLDRALVPADEAASVDPSHPFALFDMDPASPDHGARIPYRLDIRDDTNALGQTDHTAVLYPSIALRPRGTYALVVTRGVFGPDAPERPLRPSSFFERAAGDPEPGEPEAVARARESIAPVLEFLEQVPAVAVHREDVALAVRVSVRSDDDLPADLLAVKADALAAAPPPLTVSSVSPRAQGAVLRGTVSLPSYLDPVFNVIARDGDGRPVQTGREDVPFVLRLPGTQHTPAPVVMYQHGNPGSPEEAANDNLNGYLSGAGFAVGGIQDYLNRRLGDIDQQIGATFFFLLQTRELPAFWNQTGADMIHWLRALQGLGSADWLPVGAPDGLPDLDPARLLYHGISEGGNNALRFLPYAPEILAATPTVGGGRLVETLLHQLDTGLLSTLEGFIPGVRPVQTLVGLSLFQHGFDAQEAHSYARFAYRAPLAIPGLPGARAPSVLWTEGIGDSLVPNNATRSAARELGIPTMRPVKQGSPVLTEVDGPLRGNLGGDRTVGHFQFDPATTPSCGPGAEGHYCPQDAPSAQAQRLHFFHTALQDAAPEIIDPLE